MHCDFGSYDENEVLCTKKGHQFETLTVWWQIGVFAFSWFDEATYFIWSTNLESVTQICVSECDHGLLHKFVFDIHPIIVNVRLHWLNWWL